MNFEEIVQQNLKLTADSLESLRGISCEICLPKGHLLFKEGLTNNNIYIIATGIARAYVNLENIQATFAFFLEKERCYYLLRVT